MKAWFKKVREKLNGEKRKKYLLAGVAALTVIVCSVAGVVAVSSIRKEPAKTQTGSEARKNSDGEKSMYMTSGNVDVGTKTMSLWISVNLQLQKVFPWILSWAEWRCPA